MIGKLKGSVDSICEDHILLDVNGVGYLVYLTIRTLSSLKLGSTLVLYINMHVREDHINLYGFETLKEKETYLILQTVGGVGTRMAMQILSRFSPTELARAIYNRDKDLLRTISGVGLKLAERLLIELKDKLTLEDIEFLSQGASQVDDHQKALFKDASEALCNLGIQKNDADKRVASILSVHTHIELSDLITEALRSKV